jgi:HAE1 family hydrophobic/amphiphilic exporter-1
LQDLAWIIIGGLISSMFLMLVVVPLVYHLNRALGKFGWDRKTEMVIGE